MLDYTLFGESHGPAVGVLLENIPAGLAIDEDFIAGQLLRRSGKGGLTTARQEADKVDYLSGVFEGRTTGDPLVAILRNSDTRSGDYEALKNTPRPGHADYAACLRAGGCNDYRGGGHHSGRLTAPLVVAGGIAQTWLRERGITISAEVVQEDALRERAAEAKAERDSVGGQIRCTVCGIPAGLGGFGWRKAVDSEIARQMFAIPAVKAVGFGDGEGFACLRGSEANDALRTDGGHITMASNHAGGVSGGITNGMPIVFTVTFRPTPSIGKPQQTVDITTMKNVEITVEGRHDACVALRAAPVVEAAAALAVMRLLPPGDTLEDYRQELDRIDRDIAVLAARRLEIAEKIGNYKKEKGLPIRDAAREAAVLQSRGDLAPEYRRQMEELFALLMRQSREEQQ